MIAVKGAKRTNRLIEGGTFQFSDILEVEEKIEDLAMSKVRKQGPGTMGA